MPAMKWSIFEQLSDETLQINILGAMFATIIGVALFRSVRFLICITVGPVIGVVWILGVMQALGDQITVFTSILAPLLFVIAYTNAAHIIFRVLEQNSDDSAWEISWRAVTRVFPACAISTLTTGIGFASLTFVGSEMIAQFGFYCALGALFVFVSVMTCTPALCAIFGISRDPNRERILATAGNYFESASTFVSKRKIGITIGGVLLTFLAAYLAFQNQPNYFFKENFSPSGEFYQALEQGDTHFSGTMTANVSITWKDSDQIKASELILLETEIARHAKRIFGSFSVASLGKILNNQLITTNTSLDDLSLSIPSSVRQQFVSADSKTTLVTIPIRDIGALKLIPRFDTMRNELRLLEERYPHVELAMSGIAPLAMYASEHQIAEMGKSLVFAMLVIFLVLMLALKSIRVAVICMFANMLPIAAVAALLSVLGIPLYYNSVLVLIIYLGIAVDDSVHFTMRYKNECLKYRSGQQVLKRSIVGVGLVLLFTTLILGAGFASLLFSSIAVINLMGALSILSLTLALLTDLILLPALLSRVDFASFEERALSN